MRSAATVLTHSPVGLDAGESTGARGTRRPRPGRPTAWLVCGAGSGEEKQPVCAPNRASHPRLPSLALTLFLLTPGATGHAEGADRLSQENDVVSSFTLRPSRQGELVPEFVDNTVKDIDEQLRQLRDEVSRLEAARSALTGGRRGPGRPRGSASRTTPARSTRTRATRARTGRRATHRATHQHAARSIHARPKHARRPDLGAGSSATWHHNSADRRGDEDPAQLPVPRAAATGLRGPAQA